MIAVAAMLLPGTDPVTMLISMAPLYALFEQADASAARWIDRDRERLGAPRTRAKLCPGARLVTRGASVVALEPDQPARLAPTTRTASAAMDVRS